jgi:predicted acylesterase/phospholipase RssA
MADWTKLAQEHPRYKQLAQKYSEPRPRRLLSLDGGGIRGVITLQVLAELERQLKEKTGGGDEFRLGDYFDYIGGTSTGAIIASALAYGHSVKEIADLYDSLGKRMFQKPWNPLKQLWYKYQSEPLIEQLREIFGKDEDGDDFKLGSGQLRCLLLLVLRNVSTDSPWPISNNPFARYNIGEGADYGAKRSNLFVPLHQLVRASTAAPTFFAPQEIEVSSKSSVKKFKFEDGGVTPYNNPAFLLYRMATVASYNLAWEKGEDKLLLVSIGTGAAPRLQENLGANFLLNNAALIPNALMYGALIDQDINCRMTGRCVHGSKLDSELGDLIPPATTGTGGPTFTPRPGNERAFIYARYNAELSPGWFKDHGFAGLDPEVVGKLDSTDHIEDLRRIGLKVAEEVDVSKFGSVV